MPTLGLNMARITHLAHEAQDRPHFFDLFWILFSAPGHGMITFVIF